MRGAASRLQSVRKQIGPALIRVWRRSESVGEGVAQRHDGSTLVGTSNFHTGEEEERLEGCPSERGCGGEVAGRRDVVGLQARFVLRCRGNIVGEIEAHGKITECRHIERHGIADDDATGRHHDRGRPTEPEHPIGAGMDRGISCAEGDVCRGNHQVARPIRVGEPDAHPRASDARMNNLPQRLSGDLDGRAVGLRARCPRGEPAILSMPLASRIPAVQRIPATAVVAITRASQRFDRERISFSPSTFLALFASRSFVAFLHFALLGSASCRWRSAHWRRVRIARACRSAASVSLKPTRRRADDLLGPELCAHAIAMTLRRCASMRPGRRIGAPNMCPTVRNHGAPRDPRPRFYRTCRAAAIDARGARRLPCDETTRFIS